MSDGVDKNEVSKSGSKKILALLDSLRQSPSGALLFCQVERLLSQNDSSCSRVEQAYADMLSMMVQVLANQAEPGSLLQVQLFMLDKLMQPPLSLSEIETLAGYLELHAQKASAANALEEGVLRDALSPLMAGFGIAKQAISTADTAETITQVEKPAPVAPVINEEAPEPILCSEPEPDAEVPKATVIQSEADSLHTPKDYGPTAQEEQFKRRGHAPKTPEQKKAPLPAAKLEKHRRDFRSLQLNLARQVSETTAQAEGFADTLQSIVENLRGARSGDDVDTVKRGLLSELQRMLSDHRNFSDSLDSTSDFLHEIESNSQELSDELSRVRLLSLTDELTELPNRRAFLRRLEDEVGRVQRYGFPLALAVIDLDHFKEVNDVYGHAAGDAALKVYSKNVLSAFRHHDLVARYGGEEFVVMLPNTDQHGAMRALHKVQSRAAETRYQFNSHDEPVPTFSAGIALYKNGDTPSTFIERADNALYQAKRLGRNRIEMDGVSSDSEIDTHDS